MPKKFLHRPDIIALLEQMRREMINRGSLLDRSGLAEVLPQWSSRERTTWTGSPKGE